MGTILEGNDLDQEQIRIYTFHANIHRRNLHSFHSSRATKIQRRNSAEYDRYRVDNEL